MRHVIGDRATMVNKLEIAQLAVETAKNWFRENIPALDADRHVIYQVELKTRL